MKLNMDEKELAKLFSKLLKDDFKSRTELGKLPTINEEMAIESNNFEGCFLNGIIYFRRKDNYHIILRLTSKKIIFKYKIKSDHYIPYNKELVSTDGRKMRKIFEEVKRMFFEYNLTNDYQWKSI